MSRIDRIWHPYTREADRPAEGWPVLVRGEGIYLFDESGRRYVDAVSSWWACAAGHAHPRLVEAIARQAAALDHSILGNLSHPPALDLARALCDLMPSPDRRVHFASDGAGAVEVALKIALQHGVNTGRPQRRRLLSLEGAYHGDTLGAMAVGYQPGFHAPFRELMFHPFQIPFPRTPAEEAAGLRAAEARMLDPSGNTAALIVEPLCQGAAGMRMYRPGFLAALADLCRRADALFVVDEIATGFGRTGTMFAFEQAGVDPDIVCVGKALSGGTLPISAAIVRDAVYDSFCDPAGEQMLYHGHTFAGNPIACAAALAALRIYREERLPERAATLGRRMREAFLPLRALPGVADVRTLGLIGAVEFRDAALARRARDRLFREGVLTRPLGPVLYLMPPLVIGEDAFEALLSSFGTAVSAVAAAESDTRTATIVMSS